MEAQAGSFIGSLLPLIIILVIFYFLIIRPQQQEAKKHQEMINSLSKGDKIITKGGLIAEVVKPEKDFIKIKLNENIIVRIDKDYVASKSNTKDLLKKEA